MRFHINGKQIFYFDMQIQIIPFSSKFDINPQIILRAMGKRNPQWLTEESQLLRPADIQLPTQDPQQAKNYRESIRLVLPPIWIE